MDECFRDQTRAWWDQFLRSGSFDLFEQMLREVEDAEALTIDIQVRTSTGAPVPQPVALMLVMRTALNTLGLSYMLERWRAGEAQ